MILANRLRMKRKVASGGTWTPENLSGLLVWYDFTEDHLVLSGSEITQILDRSGNENHATKYTGNISILNFSLNEDIGLHGGYFSDYKIGRFSFASALSNIGSVAYVARLMGEVPQKFIFGSSFYYDFHPGLSGLYIYSNLYAAQPVINGITHVGDTIYSPSSSAVYSTNTDSYISVLTSNTGRSDGCFFDRHIGDRTPVGYFHEIIISSSMFSASDISSLRTYFSERWGV